MSPQDQSPSRTAAAPMPHTYCIPAVVVPQGGGAILVRAGRPMERLTPAQFAQQVGLSRNSVYRYIGTDSLPDRFVIQAGARKILIAAAAVTHFLEHWRSERGAS